MLLLLMNDCKLDDCTDRHESMLVNERGVKVAREQESTPRRSSRGDVGIRASKPASKRTQAPGQYRCVRLQVRQGSSRRYPRDRNQTETGQQRESRWNKKNNQGVVCERKGRGVACVDVVGGSLGSTAPFRLPLSNMLSPGIVWKYEIHQREYIRGTTKTDHRGKEIAWGNRTEGWIQAGQALG